MNSIDAQNSDHYKSIAKNAVAHMSFSSLRSYHNNKSEFYRMYVLREPLETVPVAMAVGTAVHKGIELYLKGKDPYTAEDLLGFSLNPGQEIEYGAKGTKEAAITQIETALEWFHKYPGDWCAVESEEGWTVQVDPEVKVKGFADAIHETMEGTHIIDFKTVGSLSYPVNMVYYLQALTYKMLADCAGYDVKKATFLEIKKTPLKNRKMEHAGNMIREHVFLETSMTDLDVFALQELYRLTYREIIHGEQHYLPNLFAQYATMEDWEKWKKRLQLV